MAQKIDDPVPPSTTNERSQLLRFSRYSEYGHIPRDDITKTLDLPRQQRLANYLQADIDTKWVEYPLLVGFLLAGLIDAGAYNAYECFVTMMTGNTIFAALSISDLPVSASSYAWTKSLTAILSFFLAVLTFSAVHRYFGPRKRCVLFACYLFQTILIALAALIVTLHHGVSESPAKGRNSHNHQSFNSIDAHHGLVQPALSSLPAKNPDFPWLDLVPIALLSFHAADKILVSRVLQKGYLSGVVLTVLYADLRSDPALFTAGLLEGKARNHRAGGFVLYFIGAVLGGVFASSSAGFSGALWLAAAMNMVITCLWLGWKEDQGEETEEDA